MLGLFLEQLLVEQERSDLLLVLLVDIHRLADVAVVLDAFDALGAAEEHELVVVCGCEIRAADFFEAGLGDIVIQDHAALCDRELRAVAAGEFVSVIAAVVVARRKQDAHVGMHGRNREGDFGIWDDIVKEIDLEPVRDE